MIFSIFGLLDVLCHRFILRCFLECFNQLQRLLILFSDVEKVLYVRIEAIIAMDLEQFLGMIKTHEDARPLEYGTYHVHTVASTLTTFCPEIILQI